MEKLILKGKKEVKNLLVGSLNQTIQALGVSKATKKTDKLVERTAKKIAAVVGKQLKKDSKKVNKLKKKGDTKKQKKVAVAA